jgi:6-phospho-beta-glucosidase
MVFGLRVYIDGADRTAEAVSLAARPAEQSSMKNIHAAPWVPVFIEALGVLPCSYQRYYYKSAEMLAEALESFAKNGTRAEVVKRVERELFEKYREPNLDIKPPELAQRGGAHYSDAACNLICSIYSDRKDIQYVNTLNRGAIPFLPGDVAVEVSAVITKEGPIPIAVGNPPIAAQGLIYSIKSFERVAVEAAVTGDYGKALLAMTINPLVPGDTVAKEILDEMLVAHKEYLPRFFEDGKLKSGTDLLKV